MARFFIIASLVVYLLLFTACTARSEVQEAQTELLELKAQLLVAEINLENKTSDLVEAKADLERLREDLSLAQVNREKVANHLSTTVSEYNDLKATAEEVTTDVRWLLKIMNIGIAMENSNNMSTTDATEAIRDAPDEFWAVIEQTGLDRLDSPEGEEKMLIAMRNLLERLADDLDIDKKH